MAGKRRGHGDGCLYERTVGGKVQIVGMVSLGRDGNGKRIRLTVHGATRAEVKAKLKEIQRSHEAGLEVGRAAPSVAEWLTKWLEQLEAKNKRYGTLRRYSSLVRGHLIQGLGHHRLDKLSRVHVDDFLNSKRSELAPRTVHHLRAVLRTALNRAVKDGRILRNPAALTDPVAVPSEPRRFLSTDEAQAILKASEADAKASTEPFTATQRHAIYSLALNVGPRIGEALALRWKDIDLDAGRLSVVYNLQRVRGKLDPSSARSRTIPGSCAWRCSCRLSGSTPREAVENFLDPLRATLDCVVDPVLQVRGGYFQRVEPHGLTLARGEAVAMPGSGLALTIRQHYRIVEWEGDRGPYKVQTAGYMYAVDDDRGEVLAYH